MLSRKATARVLQALIEAELAASRQRLSGATRLQGSSVGSWPEEISLSSGERGHLGLDSLEMMATAAAINEMFHLHESADEIDLMALDTFGDWLDIILAAWNGGVSQMTFMTSGSTGVPKRCVHKLESLAEEADFLAQLFQTRRRLLALAPAHHIYGCLLTAFVADRLAVDVVPAANCTPKFMNGALMPGDLIVSFPERWAAIDRMVVSWPPDVEGVVSTAPCPPSLLASLHDRGMAGMTELYGSSETGGIGWRRYPSSEFALMPQWRFAETDDGEAAEVGLLYRNGRSCEPLDHLTRRGRRTFTVGGRRDGGVQVGGINVWPQRIAAELERHPKVRAAFVDLTVTPSGPCLEAFVVPVSSDLEDDLRPELETWCRQRLTMIECPRIWSFRDVLPSRAPANG